MAPRLTTLVFALAVATGADASQRQLRSTEPGVGDVAEFAHLLPFRPRRQPEHMFKTRCINFLNHQLEKGAYDPTLTGNILPNCHWTEAECKSLEDDLKARLAATAGAPAGAPAPAPAAAALVSEESSVHKQAPLASVSAPPSAWGPMHQSGVLNPLAAPRPPLIGGHEDLYGWCDTMYEMDKARAIGEMTPAAPSGAPAPAAVMMLNTRPAYQSM